MVDEVDSDDADYTQEPVTPVKGRKTRAKYVIVYISVHSYSLFSRKTIKFEKFIEDSDVEDQEAR